MVNLVSTDEYSIIHQYSAEVPELNAGGENITAKLEDNSRGRWKLAILRVKPTDYAAGRTVSFEIKDEDDQIVVPLGSVSIDNQSLNIPTLDETLAADNTINQILRDYIFAGGDYLLVTWAALAQNEVADLLFRARTGAAKVKVTWASSGTLGTVTTDYDQTR